MILGIGCDICDIRRIEKLMQEQGERFLKRVFTESEIGRINQRSHPASGFAKLFAAKEALVKALGDTTDISWQDIEVIKNACGRPEYVLQGNAHAMACELSGGDYALHLSLSDEVPYAMAYAVFCKKG